MWALDLGASVISMSLGIDFPGAVNRQVDKGIPVQSATSQALQGYLDNLRLFDAVADFLASNARFGKSAMVVAATGNESRRSAEVPYTVLVAPPASSRGFIAVGAVGRGVDGELTLATFSNSGAAVVAPGVDIVSAKAGGGLVTHSGTSMATPHVAGVAALWAEKMTAAEGSVDLQVLERRLTGTGRELPGLLRGDVGTGLVTAPTT
jgi:subtilisin family serine protease